MKIRRVAVGRIASGSSSIGTGKFAIGKGPAAIKPQKMPKISSIPTNKMVKPRAYTHKHGGFPKGLVC